MKKRWIAVGVVGLVAAVGYAGWKTYPIHALTLIDRVMNPIAARQTISWSTGPQEPASQTRPPNIILIVADDLGINDLTSTGAGIANGALPTRNIDSIASEGAMFDAGYTANATCSPSRAALMTGRYPRRYGFEFTAVPKLFAKNLAKPQADRTLQPIYHSEREKDMPSLDDMGVPASEITIAELLKVQGYHTLHIGKWHIGSAPKLRPEAQGFDESLGIMSGAGKFMQDDDPNVVNAKLPWDPIDEFLWINATDAVQWNGGQRFHINEYMTDYFSNQAVSAIKANKNRPFFMYLAYNAPHTPLQAKKSDYDQLSGIKDHNTRVYAAMILALDRGIGQVLATLKDQGIDDNTIVIFASDNGGAWYAGLPDINKPYRGWKASFFEGGIRTPYFIRWPGKIAPGQKINMPAHHLDVFATAAAAAGASLPSDRKMDGVNLLPYVTGTTGLSTERTLFWRSGGYGVVRAGQWKLQQAASPDKTWLFDLSADPTEQNNLAAQMPDKVAELRALMSAHDAEMPKPLWPALIEDAVRIDVPSNAPWSPDQEYVYWSN